MKSYNRIPKLLNLIEYLWDKNPNLRLGQLLLNCQYATNKDLYFLEDDELETILRKVYDKKQIDIWD